MGRIILILTLLFTTLVNAQDLEKKNLYYGNKAYENESYEDAVEYYQEAVNASPLSFKPNNNMANAYFRLKDFQKASDLYGSIIDLAPTAYDRSMVYYNLGNSYFMNQKLDEAIDAYKSALKLNPHDEDARYNLAYALLLKNQQDQQEKNQDKNENQNSDKNENQDKQQNSDKNENQDKNDGDKDKQGGDKDEQDGDEKDNQDNSSDKNQDKQGNQQNSTTPKISKEQAKRILDTALKNEKDTRKKMEKYKQVGTGESKKKDW